MQEPGKQVPDNPYAPPATHVVGEPIANKHESEPLPVSVTFSLVLLLVAFEVAVAFCCLVPSPRVDANLVLFLVEVGPLCAAIYCGMRCNFRHSLIPLLLGNIAAWSSFTFAVRLFNSLGWTSINVARSDAAPFILIACGSQLLLLLVVWIVAVKRKNGSSVGRTR